MSFASFKTYPTGKGFGTFFGENGFSFLVLDNVDASDIATKDNIDKKNYSGLTTIPLDFSDFPPSTLLPTQAADRGSKKSLFIHRF
mmetsp:Transcript_2407/g.5759  ORF Transcript_2407/g.5759 Transcript_2407/m.5759 type:complete len:86 (+) Transcript_2407:150-407(+)